MTEYQKIKNDDVEARPPTYGGGGLFGLFEGEPPPKMTGWLNKQSRGKSGGMFSAFTKGLKWDKRFFILDNQLIRYYEKEVDDINNSEFKGEVNLINAIILTDVTPHTNGKTGHFIGLSLDNGVTCELLLDASNAETHEKWREAIDKHIKAQVNIIDKSDNRNSTAITDESADSSCCSCCPTSDCFSGWCSFLNCFADEETEPPEFTQWAQKFSRSRKRFNFLFRNWRKRYFVMKEGKIMYYEFCEDGGVSGYKGYLSLYSTSLIEDATQFSNDSEGIYIGISLDDGSTCELLLKVDDEEKKTHWCTMLHRHIEFAKANPTISNAPPGEEANTFGVFTDRIASSGLRSLNRLVDAFVRSAPRKTKDESGFYTDEEARKMGEKGMDRDDMNKLEEIERNEALECFVNIVKQKIKSNKLVCQIPTCFVFKEPKDDEGGGGPQYNWYADKLSQAVQCKFDQMFKCDIIDTDTAEKGNDTRYAKTSKDALLKKIADSNLCEVIINSPLKFVGGHNSTFIVVAWYLEPLDTLAKRQNQLALLDEVKITKLHEKIKEELQKKRLAADGKTLLYSPDKYKLAPDGKDGEEFEGSKLYGTGYEYIYASFAMGKLLEDGIKEPLMKTSDVVQLKKINLALDALQFYFDDSIANGQLQAYYPLHSTLLELETKFTDQNSILSLPWDYDVRVLRDYFGEKIGYYFRFIQHYASYLAFLALISTFMELWLYFSGASRGTPIALFAVVVIFWGGLLMADWSYQANIQSFEWGMENYENVAIVRAQFKETVVVDPNEPQDKEMVEMNKAAKQIAQDLKTIEKESESNVLCTIHIPLLSPDYISPIVVPKLYCCWSKPEDKDADQEEGATYSLGDEDKYAGDPCGWIQFKITGLLLGGAETVKSPVDRNVSEYVYRSQANHSLRKWIATAVMFASAATIVACTFGIYYLQAYMQTNQTGLVAQYSDKITSFLNNAQTAILAPIFASLMIVMNDFENHRTITAYNDALILKKSCLVFLNTFFSYYYIAFIAQNIVYDFNGQDVAASGSCGGYATCMDALCYNLLFAVLTDFTILVKTRVEAPIIDYFHHLYINEFRQVAEWIGHFFELPLKPQKNLIKKSKDDVNNFTREVVKQYAHRANSGSYTGTHLFEDYTKLFVQFGYLMLFLPALPAVSIICFITCWVNLKLDSQKLFDNFLRPFPAGSPDIGSWRGSFNSMAMAAIPTNAAVVVFTMNAFNIDTFSVKLIVFIGMQWVISVILYIAQAIYSGEAVKVTIQRSRTRNILQNLENLVGDDKLQKSDTQLRAQIQETETYKKKSEDLQKKVAVLDQENKRLRAAAK